MKYDPDFTVSAELRARIVSAMSKTQPAQEVQKSKKSDNRKVALKK